VSDNSHDQARELSAHDVGLVAGAKVLEIPIGPITIQLNFDDGCCAVWNCKDFAGGACPQRAAAGGSKPLTGKTIDVGSTAFVEAAKTGSPTPITSSRKG
jgi:hypothetical protein